LYKELREAKALQAVEQLTNGGHYIANEYLYLL